MVFCTKINELSIKLYQTIALDQQSNIVISPILLQSIIVLIKSHSDNDTLKELNNFFDFENELSNEKFIENFKNLLKSLKYSSMKFLNKIFINQERQVLKEFIKNSEKSFHIECESVDFKLKNSKIVDLMNSLIDERTSGKIKNTVESSMINQLTELFIISAIAYDASFLYPFKIDSTNNLSFNIDNETLLEVPMIYSQAQYKFGVLRDLKISIVEIPFMKTDVVCYMLLPSSVDGLKNLELDLNNIDFDQLSSKLLLQNVNICLPKIELHSSFRLKSYLKKINLGNIFGRNADFIGITENKDKLFISDILHDVHINICDKISNEDAKFVTDGGIGCSKYTKQFICDHPFMYVLYDVKLKTIVFMGRVVNPKNLNTN